MLNNDYNTEEILFRDMRFFKKAFRYAQAYHLETLWLGNFIGAIRNGASVKEALRAAEIQEEDL